MNRKDRALLVGTLLGDSSIHLTKYNPVFQFTHQIKQKEYAFLKAHLTAKMMKRAERDPKYYKTKTAYGEVEYFKFSMGHKYFKYLHRVLYSNDGKKYFSRKILDYLSPQGIAWWYMDDGGVNKNSNKKNNTDWVTVEMRISTYCSLIEIENIITYFNEVWGIEAKKRYAKKTDSYYLAFNSKNSVKLEELISEFITPQFRYKLPSFYNPRVQSTPLAAAKGDDIV